MASSDCGMPVGDLSPRLSQYLAARGAIPASVESFDCVNPANVRAALNCLPDVMFDMISSADGAGSLEADDAYEINHSLTAALASSPTMSVLSPHKNGSTS